MFKKKHQSFGFTLIELTLTLVLLGFLAMAAIPTSASWSSVEITSTTSQIQSELRFLQNFAKTTGQPQAFKVTSSTLYKSGDLADIDNAQTSDLTFPNNANMTFSNSDIQIEFNEFGLPTSASDLTLTLTDGTASKQITILQNTGHISLSDG